MELRGLVADVSASARLKTIPRVELRRGSSARTGFRKICIGRRLRSRLTDKEMKGVIAHEVHHIAELRRNLGVTTLITILTPLAIVAIASIAFLAAMYRFPSMISFLPIDIFQAIALISILLSMLAIWRHTSRIEELNADRFAGSMVGARVFAKTLKKVYLIRAKVGILAKLREFIFPHPTLDERLKVIANLSRLQDNINSMLDTLRSSQEPGRICMS